MSARQNNKNTATEILAEFAAELKWDKIPKKVIEDVKMRILDMIGLCYASKPTNFYKTMLSMAKENGGNPHCTVIGENLKLPASLAVLVNGTAAHVLDFDDIHRKSIVNDSAYVVPVALSVAEKCRKSGRELITAAIAGYEAVIRMGLAEFHLQGFCTTPVAGTLAAALIAGKLYNLNKNKIVNAMGISGSQAFGVLEFLKDRSRVERIYPGWTGHSGIIAAELASLGMTGPKTILERGFCLSRTHTGDHNFDTDILSKGLGKKWETLDTCFKSFPGEVTIAMKDGEKIFLKTSNNRTGASSPMSSEEIIAKFRKNCRLIIDENKIERIMEAVLTIDEESNIKNFTQLLAKDEESYQYDDYSYDGIVNIDIEMPL